MRTRRPEVADVFREYGAEYLQAHVTTAAHRRVLRDLSCCRTAALGGHKRQCDACGHEQIAYNSCRNRHCPKCQAMARARWLEAREAELLDTQYFHVVFTLPDDLGPWALQNKRLVYGILFRAASETLLRVARDRRHLGAEIGFLAILHTWGQKLDLHPHLHIVVPGGGIASNGRHWIPCRHNFFLPVRRLSRLFRGKVLALLGEAVESGRLRFPAQAETGAQDHAWPDLVHRLRSREWVVYCKPPFGGPRQVLKYLARYTHRVAIANRRIVSIHDGAVTFQWKDYADLSHTRTMTLHAGEFIRRFLLHVLPSGFVRMRHYGFLANRARREKLPLCRKLLGQSAPSPILPKPDATTASPRCPHCKKGRLLIVATLKGTDPLTPLIFPAFDTS